MSTIDKLTGSSIKFNSLGNNLFGKGVNANALLALFADPQFIQAVQLSAAAGKDPFEELSQFILSKKDLPNGGKGAAPGQYLQIGKGLFIDSGGLSKALPGYKQDALDFYMKQSDAALEQIKKSPAFATQAAYAEGKFDDQYMKNVNAVFDPLAAKKLGSLGVKGQLQDPAQTGKAIADVSQMKSQFLLGQQQQAQQFLNAAAGYPGALGFTPGAMAAPPNVGGIQNSLMNISQMLTDVNKFNAQGEFQQSQAQASAFQDFMGSIAGGLGGIYQTQNSNNQLNKILGSMGGGGGGGGGFDPMMLLKMFGMFG